MRQVEALSPLWRVIASGGTPRGDPEESARGTRVVLSRAFRLDCYAALAMTRAKREAGRSLYFTTRHRERQDTAWRSNDFSTLGRALYFLNNIVALTIAIKNVLSQQL